MYYKIINDRTVFSDCKSLFIEAENRWVSNPSEEQIFAEGWKVYVPPVVPPAPQTEPDYEDVVAAIKKMFAHDTEELSDEDALEVAALYPTWVSKIGEQVNAGERYWYDGKLWKVVQAHTVQEDWTPDTATSLWTEVSIEEFPEWRQPTGAQDAYRTGDKVSYNGKHWESIIDYNTYAPDVYGWNLLN